MSAIEAKREDNKPDATAVPQLDVSKLHSLPTEQQDLFLLNYVSELRQYAQNLSSELLTPRQAAVKKEVIKIVGLGAPAPSRVVRQNLGRILADCFERGSSQNLHETVQELLSFVNASKGEKDLSNRHVAAVCLGLLFRAAGGSAVSLVGIVSAGLLRLIKLSSNHAGLRASTLRSLGQIVQGLGSSLDEQVARDIWKISRNLASSDKAAVVQKHACICLQSLVCHTSYFANSSDHENLKTTIWKVLDSGSPVVRKSAATVLVEALIGAFSENSLGDTAPVVKKTKKSKKQDAVGDEDNEDERPSTATPIKSPTQLLLSLTDILKVLSNQYSKQSTTNRTRSGLAMCYKIFLEKLPERIVQERYAIIASHFLYDLIDHPVVSNNRYRLLLTRKFVHVLLSDVVATSILSESGQINAARWLINDVLKNYPKTTSERKEPSKRVLAAALRTLSYLLEALGPASNSFQDSCREAMFQALQHSSYTVQVHAAQCFRIFVKACPNQMARSIEQATSQIKTDLDPAAESRSRRRALGMAMSIAAMLSSAHDHPLYGSIELFAGAFTFATDLLKNSGSSELRLCAAQVQIAWTIIGGLMALGPSFVKVHLNQLLLLWRNASPPPMAENSSKQGHLEMSFLTHVRECALTALHTFLAHNSSLITLDGSRRISSVLHNSVSFLDTMPSVRHTEELSGRLVPALQLQDYVTMLRRRVLQCMTRLISLKNIDHSETSSQSDVIGLTLRTFINPERPTSRSLEASLNSSASNFEGIWELGDNWGSGVNSLLQGHELYLPTTGSSRKVGIANITLDSIELALSESTTSPIIGAFEHDAALLCCHDVKEDDAELASAPTSSVSAAIHLFAIAFPLQAARVQESCIEQLATALAQSYPRDPGRKVVTQLNTATALVCTLAVANGETPYPSGKLAAKSISNTTAEILKRLLIESDSILRNLAAQALGRLCNLAGSHFTGVEIKMLIDTIVANRDPNARAGCALALGQVHSQVGAMAASYHLKTIVGVLLSLCSDPHPVVHFWSLHGLAAVAESAGLTFSGYATSTLGMLAQLYSNDSHNEETALLASSNLEMDYPTPLVIGQCVDAIINVLGPDLQDVSKTRILILTLVGYFQSEESVCIQMESLICLGHISMYAPAHVQLTGYVHNLQSALTSGNKLLKSTATLGLETLMKRNANEVLRVSKTGLADELWSTLDKASETRSLENTLRSWMQQTCLQETAEWIQRCQAVLSRTRVTKEPKAVAVQPAPQNAVPDLVDEDVAGLAASAAVAQAEVSDNTTEGQEFLKWQTRNFAMQLLTEMLDMIRNAMLLDQVIPAEAVLQSKVGDIVRVAFAASTAGVVSVRVLGLRILDQILKLFGKTPDPDFLEASLLEQYQAQISSALTPAFAADSTPELAAAAMTVSATFVATGIVTNVDRMGRIFKVLATSLENWSSTTPEAAVGDLKDLTPSAQSMLKMSLLSGWAELQLASSEQPYLEEIVQPFIPKLAPLWLSSLQEFAALRFEPEISNTLGGDFDSGSLQERYGAFDREVRLKFFQSSWLHLVDAIAVLVEKDSSAVFDALDNKNVTSNGVDANGVQGHGKDMSFREEPVAFFFILFGLAYEALVTQAREDPTQILSILYALKTILTPAVSGNAIYQDIVFTETTDTLDRLALTSNSETQAVLVEIARNLSIEHVIAKSSDRDDKLSDDIDQLFELTRIIILVLIGLVPTLEDPPGTAQRNLSEASVILVQTCFQALVDVAEVFPSVIRSDLQACIFHCYCTMLGTGICQDEVIPRIMPVFRQFLQELTKSAAKDEKVTRLVRGGLSQMLTVLGYAQRRENSYAIICAKNTLLSMTVLLNSGGRATAGNDELVYSMLRELMDCLQDVGLAKIAANCARSLLLSNPKSACDEAISRFLWPQLLAFVNDPSKEDPELVKATIMQAIVSSVTTFQGNGRYAAMAILIPSLLFRAQQFSPKGSNEDARRESASRLLELAGIDGLAFKANVQVLDNGHRSELEELLRSVGVGARQRSETETSEEARPAIQLRMDF